MAQAEECVGSVWMILILPWRAGKSSRHARDRGADGGGGSLSTVGLLEALRSAAGGRLRVESQARVPRVLQPSAQFATTHRPGACRNASGNRQSGGARDRDG